MKLKFLVLASISMLLFSCKQNKEVDQLKEITIADVNKDQLNHEGYNLLRNNCYACHSITAKSHEDIIAPPMEAIKRRYKILYKTKAEFVEALTNWAINPKEENALMRGAINQFKVMPKQPFDKNDIIKIAEYIYDNKLEKPAWFESRFNDEHPNGMGNGQGRGRGNRKLNN